MPIEESMSFLYEILYLESNSREQKLQPVLLPLRRSYLSIENECQ